MQYKITNLKEKSWNDKNYKSADLIDTNGELFQVSAWAGEFDNKETIDCELEKNDKGYWKLLTPKKTAGANFKTQQMEKVMEKKEQSISKFQDNKEWSIKLASSMGKAVDLAIAEFKNPNDLDMLETKILKWRKWILNNWDVEPTDLNAF